MKGLAGLVLSLFDLCEAEGRLLQENVIATVRRSVILTLGLVFGAVALAFLVASAYIMSAGDMKTNMSGKLVVSVELGEGSAATIRVEKR